MGSRDTVSPAPSSHLRACVTAALQLRTRGPHLWPASVCEKAPDAGSQSLMAWSAGSRLLAATRQCDASDDMARQDTLPGSLKLPTRSRLRGSGSGRGQATHGAASCHITRTAWEGGARCVVCRLSSGKVCVQDTRWSGPGEQLQIVPHVSCTASWWFDARKKGSVFATHDE